MEIENKISLIESSVAKCTMHVFCVESKKHNLSAHQSVIIES